jgi:hypothetical protein
LYIYDAGGFSGQSLTALGVLKRCSIEYTCDVKSEILENRGKFNGIRAKSLQICKLENLLVILNI